MFPKYLRKTFVRASIDRDESGSFDVDPRRLRPQERGANGEEARNFYEATLRLTPTRDQACHNAIADRNPPAPPRDVTVKAVCLPSKAELFQAAEKDNLGPLTSYLDHDDQANVNLVDEFGWSLLMVASCSNSVNVVRHLLLRGADVQIEDRGGNSALGLARQRNHKQVERLLLGDCRGPPEEADNPNSRDSSIEEEFFCDTCQQIIHGQTEGSHKASTLHQFRSRDSNRLPTIYGIAEANRGFQMMLRSGWNREKGLGTEGQGKKYPVKTVLKKDRLGLGCPGASKQVARVTHSYHEVSQGQEISKRHRVERLATVARREQKRRVAAEVKREKVYRRELEGL